MKHELVGENGKIKHAAMTLYGYFCIRRNTKTGFCFPSLKTVHQDTGIPMSNVSQLTDFLESVFWIEKIGKQIRPLKGFYDLEFSTDEIGQKFLINRNEILLNRNGISNDLNPPLKDINNTNEQDHLTGEATRVAAPGANKSKKPAEKPAPRLSASSKKPTNAAPAGKPADNRSKHPAIQMVKTITGRFPPKDNWDKIIREINAKDVLFFKNSFEIWRSFNGSPQSFDKWLFEPNETKLPPQRFESKNGKGKPFEPGKDSGELTIEIDERDLLLPAMRETVLESLRQLRANGNGEWFFELEETYHPDDWKWLMENLEKVEQEG